MTDLDRFSQMFAALGSPQRLAIVRLLIEVGEAGLPVGEVQSRLRIPASTLSHHLDKLRQEGLTEMRRDRQWIWHRVRLDAIGHLVGFLCSTCYRPELLSPLLEEIQTQLSAQRPSGLNGQDSSSVFVKGSFHDKKTN